MSKSLRTVLLIDKTGTVKEIQVKQEDIPNNLYKKAGLKSPDDFTEQFVWELNLGENGQSRTFEIGENAEETTASSSTDNYSISIYGKKVGKHSKNAYGFPPPLEETNLYGNCLLVNNRGSITLKEWNNLFEMIYEKYDAEEDDDEAKDSSSEADDDGDAQDEADEDEEPEDELDEPDEDEGQTEKISGRKRKSNKKNVKTASSDFELTYTEEQFLDCEMELEPEEYLT